MMLHTGALLFGLFISGNTMATSPVHHDALDKIGIKSTQYNPGNFIATDETKMFPAPSQGMVQFTLSLPKLSNEQDYKVEVVLGQYHMIDCNNHRYEGKLTQKTVDGWGYYYYELTDVMQGPATMMMCKDKPTEKFVQINESMLIDYDSRLPKVYYAPKGTQLHYRLWRAKGDFVVAGQQ